MLKRNIISQLVAAAIASSLLIGCESDSGSQSTDIKGSVFSSYVSGAEVEVTDIKGNRIADPVTTDSQGQFTVSIPNANLKDDLLFVATGGNYTNIITNSDTASTKLSAFASANSLTNKPAISLTPASTIIENITSSIDNNTKAIEYFEKAFGYQPDISVTPVVANLENADASSEAKLAGVRAAAFSQLLKDLGLAEDQQTNLLTAIAKDLEDGSADGISNAQSIEISNGTDLKTDIANRFTMALMDFSKDEVNNKSGITSGDVGVLAFNQKVASTNYNFELTPQSTPMVGKSVFDLKITDSSKAAIVGVTPTMTLWMHMPGHGHSNPQTGCTETNAEGTSQCTAYFTMPSGKMGNWDVSFKITHNSNTEEARFYPSVGSLTSEDTPWLPLYGTDKDPKGGKRLYLVYKNDVVKKDNGHTVKFFIATRELMPDSTPEVADEWPLLPATGVTVKIGTEENNVNDATSEGNGIWSVDLDGLTAETLNTVYIQLSRDGDNKQSGSWNKDENGKWILTLSGYDSTAFKLTPTE